MSIHKPVLLNEVIEYLDPHPGQHFVDGTFGGGGHTKAILERNGPDGKVLSIDQDPAAIQNFELRITNYAVPAGRQELRKRIILVNENFRNIAHIVKEYFPYSVSGILLDLGFSSDQLEHSGRGFSFQVDEPLDMRMYIQGTENRDQGTAADIVNKSTKEELEKIFRVYGEESRAREIAEAIVIERKRTPIITTKQLVGIINKTSPHAVSKETKTPSHSHSSGNRRSLNSLDGRRTSMSGINPATKVFQALRIAVNDEFGALQEVLPDAFDVLAPRGRLAVISFHGGEDRLVKQFMKTVEHNGRGTNLIKRGIVASAREVKSNPRARSARLRVAEKIK